MGGEKLHKKVRVTMRAKQSEVERALGMNTGIGLSPLRGCPFTHGVPRLTPWAVFCRRFRGSHRQLTHQRCGGIGDAASATRHRLSEKRAMILRLTWCRFSGRGRP